MQHTTVLEGYQISTVYTCLSTSFTMIRIQNAHYSLRSFMLRFFVSLLRSPTNVYVLLGLFYATQYYSTNKIINVRALIFTISFRVDLVNEIIVLFAEKMYKEITWIQRFECKLKIEWIDQISMKVDQFSYINSNFSLHGSDCLMWLNMVISKYK